MQNHFSFIKLKQLHKLCKGDKDRELNYLKQFIDMITVSIQKINFAVEKGDRVTIVKELHFMSPQLVFFGIDDFSVIMEKIRKDENVLFNELKKHTDNGIVKIEKALMEVENFINNQSNNFKT